MSDPYEHENAYAKPECPSCTLLTDTLRRERNKSAGLESHNRLLTDSNKSLQLDRRNLDLQETIEVIQRHSPQMRFLVLETLITLVATEGGE